VTSTRQAADRINEDQLLNFLVNALTDDCSLELAKNASTGADTVFEVLVGACADGTSVSSMCQRSTESPHENTILYHLREQFDLETVERLGDSLLQSAVLETLPDEIEVVVDLHLRPYYGDEDDSTGLYHSQAKRGTTAFHAYATLYARVRNKRYTLAVRRVTDGETASDVLAAFFGVLDGLAVDVTAVYLDREFYDTQCLSLLQQHNYAYVMPIVRWGQPIKEELASGWSRVIEHDLTTRRDGQSWNVEFPVYIDCTYQQGRYDEHGVARHGYAADAPFIDSPREARYHYSKRFGIEASYRLSEASIATTSTRLPAVRLLYVVVSLLLQNAWRYLRWTYVSTPRRGGRRLWRWPFSEFVSMIQRATWAALAVRRSVPTNRPPDDRFRR